MRLGKNTSGFVSVRAQRVRANRSGSSEALLRTAVCFANFFIIIANRLQKRNMHMRWLLSRVGMTAPHFLAERPRMDLAGCSPCRQLHRTAYPHRPFPALPHSGAVRPVWSPSARWGRRLSLPQKSVRNGLFGKPGHPRTNSGFGGGLTQIEQKIRCSFLMKLSIYRCITRSRISWVRPWFQNWVPM